jgi:putative transposase
LIEYYQLRFQIEFNFRDAKQYWGLEDFMNISRNAVYNVANLAIFMINISFALLPKNSYCKFFGDVLTFKAELCSPWRS